MKTARRAVLSVAQVLALSGACAHGQILQVNSDSLTSYRSTSASAVQDIRPLVLQRGVGIDGALRAAPTQGWSLAGSPFGEPWDGNGRLGPLNLATGTYQPTEVDIALPAPGASGWVIGRTFNQRQETSAPAHRDSNGYQGYNWFQSSQPALLIYADKDDSAKDLIYLIYGADRFAEFKRTGSSADTYKGTNGNAGVIRLNPDGAPAGGEPDVYVLYDQHGVKTWFFGFDGDAGSAAGQIWKFVDPAGNTAYVGDPSTGSTAISSGYGSGRISKAYDGAGRRYCYTYSGGTIGGATRLTQVLVEEQGEDSWGACGENIEVGRVVYDYYTSDGDAHAKAGDLKLVTVTMPLTDSGISQVKKKYYRYYDDAWSNSDGRRGEPHCLKMIVGHEGYRNHDWTDTTLDDDPLSESDTNLKAYSEAYLETVSSGDYRIASAFFNGECGCGGGGANGTHTFTYEANGSYSDGSGYDTAWCRRVVIARPDGSYVTQYFDEAGQPLSRVITDIIPTSSSPTPLKWVTQAVRDSAGCVTEIRTPEANTGYTHTTSGSPDGSMTSSTSAGLISVFTRYASGDKTGYLEYRKHKKGTSGTAYPDALLDYSTASLTVNASAVVRPFLSSSKAYRDTTESGGSDTADETTMAYTFWSGTATNVLVVTPKVMTTTLPKVATGNNGKGDGGGDPAVESKRFLRKDGTTAFAMHEAYSDASNSDRVYDYSQFTNGQLTKRIADATTNGSFASGDDPSTDFGITETGDGLNVITQMTYDAQGRPSGTTLPDGRVTGVHYSRLADQRMTMISCPRVVSGGSTTYYGPLSYTVSNQAGKADLSATAALASAGITTALSGWIDETDADAITALDIGRITRMSRSIHDKTAAHVDESRLYHTVPASIAADSGSNYDATLLGYDTMGRQKRVKTPAGTITLTTFDKLGRTTQREVGTNDPDEGGSDDMTVVEELAYDGGSDNKNSLLTTRTVIVDETDDGGDAFDDDRVTTYTYDYRGRMLLQTNPQSPHILNKYDNLGRLLASGRYSATGSITVGTTDPAYSGTQSDRIGLSTTAYDEAGRAWKSVRSKIDVTDGSDDDTLETLHWFDAEGHEVKTLGEQLSKSAFDRLDRPTHRYILAETDDSTYAHALTVSGDHVMEETQTVYAGATSNTVVMRVVISRYYNDLENGNTGALDSNADGDRLIVTPGNLIGRAQITATWYDSLDRPTTTAFYGTYAGSTFTRTGLSEPSASASDKIVTKTGYTYDDGGTTRDDGLVHDATDPRGKVTRTVFDAQGRRTAVIANYVNGTPSGETGDDDVYTRYVYTSGHLTKMWVDFDGDNVVDTSAPKDQETLYLYGVTKGTPATMKIASKDLLRAVKYPDSANAGTTAAYIDGTSDADVVSYIYDAQQAQISVKDQAGNVIESKYDTGGRLVHSMASTIISGFDSAVQRITRAYTSRGEVDSVTQFSTTTIGSPDTSSIVDQVDFDYDNWGNVVTFTQDPDSRITSGSGRASFAPTYSWSKAAGGGSAGRNTLKCTGMTYPGGSNITYAYSQGTYDLNSPLARVSHINVGATSVALYYYLGLERSLGTWLYEAGAQRLQMQWAVSGSYPNLDRFNRLVTDQWDAQWGGVPGFMDLDIAYDEASNITSITDNILKTGGNRSFDALYTIDGLNRLTKAEEGTLSGTISNRSRQEDWTLSQVGNWKNHKLDLNGDNDWIDGGGEVQEDGTFNQVNELTTRELDTASGAGYETTYSSIAYDDVGNLTDDKQRYKYTYDVWGRLRTVKNQSSNLVAEYTYNGLNYRVGWHYDADADGTVENTSDDPWYWFCYDARWRVLATFRSTDTYPKERFVYHNAGLGGTGGSSYIDEVMMRDRDANTDWRTTAGDGTLEERRYFCQDWRNDVAAVITDTGKLVEKVKYGSYGTPFGIPVGDTDADGDWDATDSGAIGGGYAVEEDTNLDGTTDASDVTWANTITGGYQTLGRGTPSSTAVASRRAYCGYEGLSELAGNKQLARNRVLDTELGRWNRRDPLGYVDGMALYEYVGSRATIVADPLGLTGPTCYKCPTGLGHQTQTPTSPCDECCTAACDLKSSNNGITVCCGTDRAACVCDMNVSNRHRAASVPSCYTNAFLACVAAHETTHRNDIDCSRESPCKLRTGLVPPGLPWTNPNLPSACNSDCSECHAYQAQLNCLFAFNCETCPTTKDVILCRSAWIKEIGDLARLAQENCDRCAACGGS